MFRKLMCTVLAALMTATVVYGASQVVATPAVAREGSAALVANGGNRPYLEWYKQNTLGVPRTQLIYVYAEPGETIYFGSSVADGYAAVKNASVGVMMPQANGDAFSDLSFLKNPATYVGTAANQYTAQLNPEIGAGYDRSKVYLFDADATTGEGYIADVTQERIGPSYTINSTTYNAGGYAPFSITVPEGCGGLWTFMYYSSSYSNGNPTPALTTAKWTQNSGTVAAWDATVVQTASNGAVTQLSGRMACKTLFINIGDNGKTLNSDVYVMTNQGFLYNVDFNGADPYGFVFYTNNRGLLLNTASGYQSLMHSAVSSTNELTTFTSDSLNIVSNNVPVEDVDETYYIFFNEPDSAFIKFVTGRSTIVTDADLTISNIESISFTGKSDTGFENDKNEEGYSPATEGYGGTFTVVQAPGSIVSSFKVKLIFTGNEQVCSALGYPLDKENVVVLSNAFSDGTGYVTWDGKDAFGKIIPASEEVYRNIQIEVVGTAGEVHLPFLDVENNPNGIKVHLENDFASLDGDKAYNVYYNNDNSTRAYGSFGNVTKIADGKNNSYNAVDSRNGAMAYTGRLGDQCAIDMWTHVELSGSQQTDLAVLITNKNLTSLEVTKEWNNTSPTGLVDPAPPVFVNVQLQQRLVGGTWANYAGDVTAYTTPVTMVTSLETRTASVLFSNLEWHNDVNAEYEYRVVEAPVEGYALTSDTAADGVATVGYRVDAVSGLKTFEQTLVNTYQKEATLPHDTKIYKYFYGYEDNAAGIFGSNDRYSAFNDDGYYYMNTEEAATLIYRVRQQEEGLTFEELPDTSSFTDVPNNGWGRKALEWLKGILGYGENAGARSTISSDKVLAVFNAHYKNSTKQLKLTAADAVLRIDFLRAYNKALGRNNITRIYAADGTLLCTRTDDGNYVLSDAFNNHRASYIFADELPQSAEEIYQVLLAAHSYYVSADGTIAVTAPELESERYTLDLGLTEASENS